MTIHGVEEFIRHSVVDRAAEALAHKGAVASFLVARHRAPPQMGAGHYLQQPAIDSSPKASFASRSAYAQRGGVQAAANQYLDIDAAEPSAPEQLSRDGLDFRLVAVDLRQRLRPEVVKALSSTDLPVRSRSRRWRLTARRSHSRWLRRRSAFDPLNGRSLQSVAMPAHAPKRSSAMLTPQPVKTTVQRD
jgi:hypothetical protein